jgi:hypothetical protein
MNDSSRTIGGICGIAGTACYLAAAFIELPDRLTFAVAMLWPILSLVFAYGLYRWIGSERRSILNDVGFLFAAIAFTLVAAMLSIQLAVGTGAERYLLGLRTAQRGLSDNIQNMVRLVDMGLDVAWDMFIGSSLICSGLAMFSHPRIGSWWGIPALFAGASLIVLNVMTFPWPPNTQGLIDVGPFIGLYIMALSVYMVMPLRGGNRPGSGRPMRTGDVPAGKPPGREDVERTSSAGSSGRSGRPRRRYRR